MNGLQEQLHLCAKPNSTADADDVLFAVLQAYITSVQTDYPRNGYPFQKIINATLAAISPLSAIGAAVAIHNTVTSAKCLPWDFQSYLYGPFLYLRCTQIPFLSQYTAANSLWGPILPDYTQEHLLDPYCQASFGIKSIDGGEALQRKLGLDPYTLQNTPRLLIAQNMIDPTTSTGPDSWNPGPSRNDSRVMFNSHSSHVEATFPSDPLDSDALVQARKCIMSNIKGWLGM